MNERASKEVKRIPAGDRSAATVEAVNLVWEVACPEDGPAPEDLQDLDAQLSEQVPELYEALAMDPRLPDGLIEFALSSLRAAGMVQTESNLRLLLRAANDQGEV